MSKRSSVVVASALLMVGLTLMVGKLYAPLNAVSVGSGSVDYSKYLLWGGAILLVISALLYIRASSEG